jgi:NAD(P)-dependent dehydrogenase (short-subunit alcohol dehydrogenase family)
MEISLHGRSAIVTGGSKGLGLAFATARTRQTTLGYAEKVRPQFLSLRQLGRSRLFSARGCGQLSPVLAAISNLISAPRIGPVG